MSKFTDPDMETTALLARAMKEFHEELGAVGVTVAVLMAHPPENKDGEQTGPALKLRGHQCDAIASIVPIAFRAQGMKDALIKIAVDRWDGFTEEQKLALLDHELEHFVVARNLNGDPILDSCGRPKLKMKHHDVELGFFSAVARRHGMASGEVHACRQLIGLQGEIYFPFIDPKSIPGLVDAAQKSEATTKKLRGRGKK